MKALRVLRVCAVTLFGFPMLAQASAPAGWYSNVTITSIYSGTYGGGRVAIKINSAVSNGTCPSDGELQFDPDNPFFWSMFVLAMTAYKNGTPINVHTDGTCAQYGVMLTNLQLGGTVQ